MDFIDEIRNLAERALDLKNDLNTEEATKNALIMPFIRILGYDVFDPREVIPEFTADVGIKKGEKVDYAIISDGTPVVLFECKSCNTNLKNAHANQLYRYFSAVEARFGVLTNGIEYQFFTDLDSANKMDQKPFLEFNLLRIKESLVSELKKFSKGQFDVENILSTASELKYTREIKRVIAAEYENPSEDFVRFCIGEIYAGVKTQSVIEQFTTITKRAFHQFLNDSINDRLKSALSEDTAPEHAVELVESDHPSPEAESAATEEQEEETIIETTEEELRAFYIIKSILHGIIPLERVAMRDRISYCGILLDDNNRKPICRLHFNTSQKYLGVFDAERAEERIPIDCVDDIFQHAKKIKRVVPFYDTDSE